MQYISVVRQSRCLWHLGEYSINIHRACSRVGWLVLREFRAMERDNSSFRLAGHHTPTPKHDRISCCRCEATVRSTHEVHEPFVDVRDTEVFGKPTWQYDRYTTDERTRSKLDSRNHADEIMTIEVIVIIDADTQIWLFQSNFSQTIKRLNNYID